MKDYYYDVSTQNFERRDNPPPHVSNSEKEPKIHTPAYRRKYPERYGHHYTSKLEQAAYPKAGTAPSEKKSITDAEIQKKLDKLRGPHMWDQIYDSMSPHEKGSHNAEKRKQGMNGKTAEPLVKEFRSDSPDTYLSHPDQQKGMLLATLEDAKAKPKPKRINTYPEVRFAAMPVRDLNQEAREAALERTRAYAFSKIPDPDAGKGIGSFRNTIGRKLRASNSRTDWEKSNQRTYEDNTDAKE